MEKFNFQSQKKGLAIISPKCQFVASEALMRLVWLERSQVLFARAIFYI
jgi:hypothetical protein